MQILIFVVVLAVLLVTGLGVQPPPKWFDQQDKLEHLLGFFAFALALRFAWPKLNFLQVMAISSALAVVIELGQALLPSRMPSMADCGAGILGALIGWGCAAAMRRWRAPRPALDDGGEI